MKKAILLVSLMSFGFMFANAQYFQHLYGTNTTDNLTDGITVSQNGTGHFMVGTSWSNSQLTATFTDIDGNISLARFAKQFNLTLSPNIDVPCNAAKCFEIDNGGGFGIVASYYGGTNGLSYIKMNKKGTGITVTNHFNTTAYDVTIKNLIKSSSGTEAYAIGDAHRISSGRDHVFIYKFDINTGTVIWSKIYDLQGVYYPLPSQPVYHVIDGWVFDLIEAPGPYTSNGADQIVVVGELFRPNNTKVDRDALIIKLNAIDGTPAAHPHGSATGYDFNFHTSNEAFKCIKPDPNNFWLIGGDTDYPLSQRQVFTFIIDPVGFVIGGATEIYNYTAANPNKKAFSVDIDWRYNAAQNIIELFHLASVNDANVGGLDMVIFKKDLTNGISTGQFTYGDLLSDIPVALDLTEGTTYDGISIYGNYLLDNTTNNTGIGSVDGVLVKSYFNGESGCNEDLTIQTASPPPGYMHEPINLLFVSSFTASTMSVDANPISDLTLCHATTLPGGINGLSIPAEDPHKVNTMQVSPNPMLPGITTATVNLQTDVEEEVQVIVYDMLGKKYYTGSFAIKAGNNDLSFELPTAAMAKGMYTVRLSGITINKTVRLMIR